MRAINHGLLGGVGEGARIRERRALESVLSCAWLLPLDRGSGYVVLVLDFVRPFIDLIVN